MPQLEIILTILLSNLIAAVSNALRLEHYTDSFLLDQGY